MLLIDRYGEGVWHPVLMRSARPDEFAFGSPEWWLHTLEFELQQRVPWVEFFAGYRDGRHRLAFASSKFKSAFGHLFESFADNWCELVVEASVERLSVEGFRFGGDDQEADKDAWSIWQDNQLDADANLAHTEAITTGEAYLLVDDGPEGPSITVEHPGQVVVAFEPGSRRKRVAALKRWVDQYTGYAMANVYLPGRTFKYRSEDRHDGVFTQVMPVKWVRHDDGDGHEVPHKLTDVVPMVPLWNKPSLLEGGRSDLAQVIPKQDAINKFFSDAMVASEFGAFKQRLLTGVEIPKNPVTGEAMDPEKWLSAIDRVWTVPSPDAKAQEFSATDLGQFRSMIELVVQHIAAQTRTPPHYLLGQVVNISGDALKAAETGLVSKVRRKQIDFGEAWEEAIRLAFRLKGDETRGREKRVETIWRDPENQTISQLVDAAVKMRESLAIPFEMAWEMVGMTPQQTDRAKNLMGLPDRPPGAGA